MHCKGDMQRQLSPKHSVGTSWHCMQPANLYTGPPHTGHQLRNKQHGAQGTAAKAQPQATPAHSTRVLLAQCVGRHTTNLAAILTPSSVSDSHLHPMLVLPPHTKRPCPNNTTGRSKERARIESTDQQCWYKRRSLHSPLAAALPQRARPRSHSSTHSIQQYKGTHVISLATACTDRLSASKITDKRLVADG